MRFSRQEYWSEFLSCPSLGRILWGIFPTQGSNLHFLRPLHWQADSLPLVPPGIQFHHFMANTRVKKWKQWQILFSWSPKYLQTVTAPMKFKRHMFIGRKTGQHRQHVKKQKQKICTIKALVFPVVMYGMWEVDHKEDWVLKNWYFLIVVEKILESPSNCKIKPVNSKAN